MSTQGASPTAGKGDAPVMVVVDADPLERAVIEDALLRRFGPDYRVLTSGTPDDALHALELAEQGHEVALVAADLRLPGMDGVEFLGRVHALHRSCSRMLPAAMYRFHTTFPLAELSALQRAVQDGSTSRW